MHSTVLNTHCQFPTAKVTIRQTYYKCMVLNPMWLKVETFSMHFWYVYIPFSQLAIQLMVLQNGCTSQYSAHFESNRRHQQVLSTSNIIYTLKNVQNAMALILLTVACFILKENCNLENEVKTLEGLRQIASGRYAGESKKVTNIFFLNSWHHTR